MWIWYAPGRKRLLTYHTYPLLSPKNIDAYWYVPYQNTTFLRKVTFTYANGVPTAVAGITAYSFANQNAPYAYGFAINVST